MAANAAGLEEAAYLASEFIYSIDNLPGEVSHLLQEIRHRDVRTQELQQEIEKDSARYIRHSLKASGSGNSSLSSGSVPASPSSKLASVPGKIASAYAEIQELATEKEDLAQRLVALIERTRTRLDIELAKVRALSGDTADYSNLVPKPLAGLSASTDSIKNPALSMTESLKNALAGTPIGEQRQTTPSQPSTPVSASVAGSSSHKRRKVTAAPSIKVPATAWAQKRSASPTVQPTASQASHQRSRLSRQIHPTTPEQDEDEDAEGDEEVEGDDGDDNRIYCYCQQQSFGDMIACDNEEDCPYEWFHLSCAGIKGSPPDRWYCDVCKTKVANKQAAAASSSARKGRKK